MEPGLYRLNDAYGRYLVVNSEKEHSTMLLEIGGENCDKLVMEFPLEARGKDDLMLDAYGVNSCFAVVVRPLQSHFAWMKFNQQQ